MRTIALTTNRTKRALIYSRHYYKNIDRILARNRDTRKKDLEGSRKRERESKRRNYALNRTVILERNRLWRLNNPGKCHARFMKRKALKKAATINLTQISEWIARIKSKRTFVCYYCRHRFPVKLLHFDHIIALKNGGEHSARNLCASCEPCNLSKGAKLVRLWTRINQTFLEL